MSKTFSADALRGSTQTRAGEAGWFPPPSPSCRRLHLKEHRAGSARSNAAGVPVQQPAEARGAPCDGEIGFGIF